MPFSFLPAVGDALQQHLLAGGRVEHGLRAGEQREAQLAPDLVRVQDPLPMEESNSLQMSFGSTAAACAGVMCSAFFSRSISPRTCSGVDTHE